MSNKILFQKKKKCCLSYQRFKRRRSDSDNFMHISFRRGRNGEKEAGSKKKKRGGEVSELSILLGLAAKKERKQVKRPSEQKGDGAQRGLAVPRWAAAWPVSTPGPLSRTRILCFSPGCAPPGAFSQGTIQCQRIPKCQRGRCCCAVSMHASQKPHRDLMSATTGCLVCSLRYLS